MKKSTMVLGAVLIVVSAEAGNNVLLKKLQPLVGTWEDGKEKVDMVFTFTRVK